MNEVRDLVALDLAAAFLREANVILKQQGFAELATEVARPMKRVNTIRMRAHKKYRKSEDGDE